MTPDLRAARIAAYSQAHSELVAALTQFPPAMWHYQPADGWSIHAVIIHITDSEANSYIRARRLLAEPGQALMAYDEEQWAHALHYETQSTDEALALFQHLRHNTTQLIRDLPEAAWAHSAYHPQNGQMTLDDWLDVYARHVPEHIAQMQSVYAEWAAGQGA